MPFKSEKQRKWMWANDPEMAKKWGKEESINEMPNFDRGTSGLPRGFVDDYNKIVKKDRKSTTSELQSQAYIVCRLLL